MRKKTVVENIRYGDVFEFQVDGRYYYFQSIYWYYKPSGMRVIKLFFEGVSERPNDMESYLSQSLCDYYSLEYLFFSETFEEAVARFNQTFNYVGCYPPEYEKWKDEAPPFFIRFWPIDDVRRWEEKPWHLCEGSPSKTRREEKHRIREKWITDPDNSLEYYPYWLITGPFYRPIPFHMLPDSYILDAPIYTESFQEEVRFYVNRGKTPREYFIQRTTELSPEELEERVIAVKIATANRGKLKDEEVEIARAFEKERRQKPLPVNEEERLSRRFEVDSTNEEFRTDFCFGDVFEITKGKKRYYFQTIRPLNIYVDWDSPVKPKPYYLIKLIYEQFNKRPKDLAKVFDESPSQILVSHVRYSDEIEYVGNMDALSEWRDEDPRFIRYFDPYEISWEYAPQPCSTWIRADRPILGSYFVEEYCTGFSFPPRFRSTPILVPIGHDPFDKRIEQFSEKAINLVDHYVKRGVFKIDDIWSDARILAWALKGQRESRAEDTPAELSEFEAYKYTATDLRRRVKKLVSMQKSRKLFSSETIEEFKSTLSEFVDNIVGKKDDKENIRQSAKAAIRKLNRANKKLDYEFIETDEREELGEFFYMAGSYVGVDIRKLFDSARDW